VLWGRDTQGYVSRKETAASRAELVRAVQCSGEGGAKKGELPVRPQEPFKPQCKACRKTVLERGVPELFRCVARSEARSATRRGGRGGFCVRPSLRSHTLGRLVWVWPACIVAHES
jgi:hypothetical protein